MIELIAECSTNHGGSVPLAKEFIKRFTDAGADWIKFQYTRVKHLRPDDPQREWFEKSELSDEQFAELKAETEACGAKFLLTVYNHQDVPAVAKLSTEAIKVGSGEAGDNALTKAIILSQVPRRFLSIGIRPAAEAWSVAVPECFRCVSWYPTPRHLAMQAATGKWMPHERGYSCHAIGIEPSQAAIICGAKIIEKHVQLPNQARPVKPFEATVEEFKALRAFADQHPDRFIGRWQHA